MGPCKIIGSMLWGAALGPCKTISSMHWGQHWAHARSSVAHFGGQRWDHARPSVAFHGTSTGPMQDHLQHALGSVMGLHKTIGSMLGGQGGAHARPSFACIVWWLNTN